MIFMALSRFASDRLVERIGMPRNYMISASLIFIGIGLAVIFPRLLAFDDWILPGWVWHSISDPITFQLAGRSTKYSPGRLFSIIATYSIMGMLSVHR